jgi:N-glycosidase YbiA
MSEIPQIIKFYFVTEPYGFLSNFYKHDFIVDKIRYKTSEHYYQYCKLKFLQSIGEPVTDQMLSDIINANTPTIAKNLGHMPLHNIEQWDEIKVNIMMEVLRMKFKDRYLRRLLTNTGNSILVENTKYDSFWANGPNNTGQNMLGICLMQLRSELANDELTNDELANDD